MASFIKRSLGAILSAGYCIIHHYPENKGGKSSYVSKFSVELNRLLYSLSNTCQGILIYVTNVSVKKSYLILWISNVHETFDFGYILDIVQWFL